MAAVENTADSAPAVKGPKAVTLAPLNLPAKASASSDGTLSAAAAAVTAAKATKADAIRQALSDFSFMQTSQLGS